jgi:acyl dehydratase
MSIPERTESVLSVGMRFVSPGRTVTEADVVMFAALTGDYAELHTNAEFMADSEFGQRIAHGALGLAIHLGLGTRVIPTHGAVAFLGINEWAFLKPIFIGDTIHAEIEVLNIRDSVSRPGYQVVTLRRTVVNQRGETAQAGTTASLVNVPVRRTTA